MVTLLDVNFLVALLHARHVHSRRAVAWVNGQHQPCSLAICRIVQMGALRVLTNRHAMQDDVISAAQFWVGWDMMVQDERFQFVPEPPTLEHVWRELALDMQLGQMAETDLYLAAFAIAGQYDLATFDRGFRRFAGIRVVASG